ncbi:MAG: hypothetical protein PHT94_00715 [Candidatus Nanoarchaeia archaeon]|nr:hypothetical protein [Candidatus Nanoarchaeia archaeon]
MYRIENFKYEISELFNNAFLNWGITQNGKKINVYCPEIFKNKVNDIRPFNECINSKYWSCLENAAIMKKIARKNNLDAKTIITFRHEVPWSFHGMIKIGNLFYDKNFQGNVEVYTEYNIQSFGLNVRDIDFDFGHNRNHIANLLSENKDFKITA